MSCPDVDPNEVRISARWRPQHAANSQPGYQSTDTPEKISSCNECASDGCRGRPPLEPGVAIFRRGRVRRTSTGGPAVGSRPVLPAATKAPRQRDQPHQQQRIGGQIEDQSDVIDQRPDAKLRTARSLMGSTTRVTADAARQWADGRLPGGEIPQVGRQEELRLLRAGRRRDRRDPRQNSLNGARRIRRSEGSHAVRVSADARQRVPWSGDGACRGLKWARRGCGVDIEGDRCTTRFRSASPHSDPRSRRRGCGARLGLGGRPGAGRAGVRERLRGAVRPGALPSTTARPRCTSRSQCLGAGPGDEVIVGDYTFPATGHAVL